VEIAGDDGHVVPLVLAGPIAVRPGRQRDGLGRAITAHALAAIDREPDAAATVLIGDPEYYGRFFGFTDAATAGWRVPGPVERRRLLTRRINDVTLPVAGALRPRGG
jgi:predicted N-acetyltransferase YhbS